MTQQTYLTDTDEMSVEFMGFSGPAVIDAIAEGLLHTPGGPQRRRELLNLWKHETRRVAAEGGISGPKVFTMIDDFVAKIEARAVELELHGCRMSPWPTSADELN